MGTNKRTAGERRLAILVRLRTGPTNFRQLDDLPAYADTTHRERELERDIAVLRESGHNIWVDDEFNYHLDEASTIQIAADALDISLLRSFLAGKETKDVRVLAQSAITKLLADAGAGEDDVPLEVAMPSGDAIFEIAEAVEKHSCVAFRYNSASRGEADYVVEPWQLFVRFGAFYLRAWQVNVNGVAEAGVRTFKLDRIVGDPEVLKVPISHDAKPAEDEFVPIDAVVLVREGKDLPIHSRIEVIKEHPARGARQWIRGIIRSIQPGDLYDLLMFYGTDIRLVSPEDVVADFRRRLAHLEEIL